MKIVRADGFFDTDNAVFTTPNLRGLPKPPRQVQIINKKGRRRSIGSGP
jgi:hypothetical protein